MIIKKGFIINPDQYLRPNYRISPFLSIELFDSKPETDSLQWNNYANKRWENGKYAITTNAREALYLIFKQINLSSRSQVTIVTTSGNSYISSCVTGVVEKFCNWNRNVNSETDAIVVIHEFGKTYPGLEDLKKWNVPIIEDCAYAFLNSNYSIGKIGDYCIYSMPKIFPMQIGGLITTNKAIEIIPDISKDATNLIINNLNRYIDSCSEIGVLRTNNYNYLKTNFERVGISARFDYADGEVPGVFMLNTPTNTDLSALKSYCYANGIESSVFYGEDAFFIPCHQNLSVRDLDYFITVISTYFNYV